MFSEEIRSLRLSQLLDVPLTSNQKKLEKTILNLQSILSKLEVKKDVVEYPNSAFYFVKNKCYFELEIPTNRLFIHDDFVNMCSEFKYDYSGVQEIITYVLKEHLNGKNTSTHWLKEHFNDEITPVYGFKRFAENAEIYFNKSIVKYIRQLFISTLYQLISKWVENAKI